MKRISSLGVSEGAYIVVEPEWGDGKTILVSMQSNGLGNPEYSVKLDADKIRKLRKQLKRALSEIEGDTGHKDTTWKAHYLEAEGEKEEDWFSVGRIVKVTANSNEHEFKIGESVKIVGDITQGPSIYARVEYLDGDDYWWLRKDDCEPVA